MTVRPSWATGCPSHRLRTLGIYGGDIPLDVRFSTRIDATVAGNLPSGIHVSPDVNLLLSVPAEAALPAPMSRDRFPVLSVS
jgi:hypothetical protein